MADDTKSISIRNRLHLPKVGKARWIALVLLFAFMVVRVWDPAPLELLRLKTFDLYQQLKPRDLLPNSPVVIIDLDDASLQEIGQWPWPRNTVAQMVQNLFRLGVGVVGFDVVFAESDRMNGKNVVNSLVGLDADTKLKLEKLPSNDAIFGKLIRSARRVVVGQAGLNEEKEYVGRKPLRSRVFERQLKGAPKPQRWAPTFPGLLRNVDSIERFAGGHGMLNLVPEPDGIVRRVPAFFRNGERLYPTLSIEIMRLAAGRSGVVTKGGIAGIVDVAISKQIKIPTDRIGRMYPYFSKTDQKKYVSAKDVLAGTVDPKAIRGKLAILGTSAVGLLDIKTIPTERFIPGVEVHAQLIESVLTKSFLSRPGFVDAVEMSIALIGGLLIIIFVPWIGAKWTLLMFFAIAGGAGYSSWYMFSEQQVIMDAFFGIIAILLLYMTLTYTSYASEEAQRRQTRDAFSKYLSPAMVEQVVEDPSLLSLGGTKRDMTLLFCDVRGFTSISELFDAEGLTVLINKLLTPLTDIILARQGTVDKYMGDCIMAFWNAPMDDIKHAEDGCRSALEMVAAMAPLNERLKQEAKEEGRKHLDLKVGLGLNSGEAVVGNMGTAQRMDYSVLGDTVNTAARLEGQSKTYGVDIVIGPNTHEQVLEFATLDLDCIQVKGKTVGLDIYALMGDESIAVDPNFIEIKNAVAEMIKTYRNQDWDGARKMIENVRAVAEEAADSEVGPKLAVKAASSERFSLDVLCELYEGRIKAYEAEPPGADWDGVFIATTK
jgi:adenylate cyclase